MFESAQLHRLAVRELVLFSRLNYLLGWESFGSAVSIPHHLACRASVVRKIDLQPFVELMFSSRSVGVRINDS
jgi:hypothetical protein